MTRDVMRPDGYEDEGLFQTVMFGYDRTQVDEYVDAICDELHVLSSAVNRLSPVEQDLLAANAELHRLRELVSSNTATAAASVRIEQMLKLAEEEAAALRTEARAVLDAAHRDAAQMRRTAQLDGEHAAADRRREYERLREDLLAGAQAEADRIVAEANGRAGGRAVAANVKSGLVKSTADARGGPGKAGRAQGSPATAKGSPATAKGSPNKRGATPGEG